MGGAQSQPSSACPVDHEAANKQAAHAGRVKELAKQSGALMSGGAAEYPSECPMHANPAAAAAASQTADLDPKNMMPPPNQRPAPDQPFALPTERVTSNIPKLGEFEAGGKEGERWQYPSQQMFWNAMLRKGWRWKEEDIKQICAELRMNIETLGDERIGAAEGVVAGPGREKDMTDIIKIHNFNNEKAWQEILLWEKFRHPECDLVKLKSFRGNAKKLTPRAKFRHHVLGYEEPFDRHDWLVDRCGEEIHYVIDYYDGGPADPSSGDFALLDVRPALDSFGNMWDRAVVAYARKKMEWFGGGGSGAEHVHQK